ncbi:MAG: ParB N-terminal domain-containing protein [Pseudomonadota bacterium]|jgi:ParB-like chromosome segregation protein Spo0J|nr:ParB N-terminal domain-containing protein [Pseudomonadota bacterium]MED5538661.1 ParB N-terminal domain-containing protein [Pseudomonadota bacterium]
MTPESILLLDIETGDRLRAVDPARVSALIASITDLGLRTPITVVRAQRDGDECFRLVAGAHRLEAVRQSGEDYIDAFVMEGDADDAALWEIDENFARAELTDAQRAEHHVRREEILVRKGAVAKGGKGGDRRSTDKMSVGYAKSAAASLGVDERTVRRDLARGKKITPDVLSEVAGTDLDKGVVLDELARTPAEEQRAKLAEITLRRQEAERVKKDAEAANRATDRVIAMTEAERFAEWIMNRTDLGELPVIIGWLTAAKSADIAAALRRIAQ